MTKINLPEELTLNNGVTIAVSECETYITSKGVYDLRKGNYSISIFKREDGNIGADMCYLGLTTYKDFDTLNLSTESYAVLNQLN